MRDQVMGKAAGSQMAKKREQLEVCLQELLKYQCPVKATAGPALFAALEKKDEARVQRLLRCQAEVDGAVDSRGYPLIARWLLHARASGKRGTAVQHRRRGVSTN